MNWIYADVMYNQTIEIISNTSHPFPKEENVLLKISSDLKSLSVALHVPLFQYLNRL